MDDFAGAVKVPDVESEYRHVKATPCACGGPFAGRKQSLLTGPEGRRYDRIDAVCAKCGAERAFLFDISAFFGKRPMSASEKGCFALIFLGAAASAAGGVLVWRVGSPVLAFVLFGVAVFLVWLGRPGRPKEAAPSATHPKLLQRGGDTDIFQKMERLGIPMDASPRDPKTAMIGGAAKSGLYRHLRSLETQRWDEAIEGLDSTIDLLTKQADARWTQMLSVAHRLRGKAYEGAGRKAEALADYERALVLFPDDSEAKEGRARLSS